MFSSKLYRKYLGIALAATLLLFCSTTFADINFVGGGGGGGGGGAPAITGQSIVNGTGIMRSDASMIAGPVAASGANVTTLSAPSFTTDVSNAVVFNVFGTTNTENSAPSITNLVNIAAVGSTNMGLWAGYQTLSSAGASGAQTIGFASITGAAGLTIPFQPVTGQTIGVSNGATRTTTCTAGGTSTVTCNVPSATANGDTLLACFTWFPNQPVAALPPQQPSPATGTQRWANDGAWWSTAAAGNGGIQCWHKVASSEPASYTMTATGSGGVPSGFITDLTNVQTLDVPMTSATGTFSRQDVGKDLCIQGTDNSYFYNTAQNVNGQGCGQIGAFGSATKIYPNFGNLTGSTISSEQYVYGSDQGTAIQNAVNATSTGGQVVLGTGIYLMCGGNNTSTCLSFPTGAATILRGQGRALANWGFAGGGAQTAGTIVNNTNLSTYIVIANTDLTQTAWQWNPGANSVNNNVFSLTIEDLTLWGGVGTSGDGGGAAGFTATNFSGLYMDRVVVGNFLGDIVDTVASGGTQGYTDQTHFDRVWFLLSGNGHGWKSASNSAPPAAQNEYVVDSQIDNNAKNGIELTGQHYIFNLIGNNIQRNDNFNKGSLFEIHCNSCTVWGTIRGNYFENDSGTQNAALSNNATGWAAADWGANVGVGLAFSPTFSVAGAALPACGQLYASNSLGACVTDATACTNGTTYTGSSTNHCRVQCNGTNWVETGMGC